MNRLLYIGRYLLRVLAILFLQVFVFGELALFDEARPFIYLIPILYLPLRITRWQGMLLAFAIGLVVDVFFYTYGLHASIALAVFYLRDFVLYTVLGVSEEFEGAEPHIGVLGLNTFLLYTVLIILIHQILLQFLDVLSFDNFLRTFFKVLVGTLFNVVLLFVFELLFFARRLTS